MVLDLHRHALDRRIQARTLGHGPAAQHVADLEAEIVVAAAGVVQLDHEDRPPSARGRRRAVVGFGGLPEAALAAVVLDCHTPERGRTGVWGPGLDVWLPVALG